MSLPLFYCAACTLRFTFVSVFLRLYYDHNLEFHRQVPLVLALHSLVSEGVFFMSNGGFRFTALVPFNVIDLTNNFDDNTL